MNSDLFSALDILSKDTNIDFNELINNTYASSITTNIKITVFDKINQTINLQKLTPLVNRLADQINIYNLLINEKVINCDKVNLWDQYNLVCINYLAEIGFQLSNRYRLELFDNLNNKHNSINDEYLSYLQKKIKLILKIKNEVTLFIKHTKNKVFIAFGHNLKIKQKVKKFLINLNYEPVILVDQASWGMTIIERFEYNSDVGFAIIIFTKDDLGNTKNGLDLNFRARQNVVMEYGFFCGKIGRNKVSILIEADIEIPSNLTGISVIPFDHRGKWRQLLKKELELGE